MAQFTWDFTNTDMNTRGRAPEFPDGFHIAIISKVEDLPPKKDAAGNPVTTDKNGNPLKPAFYVYFSPHPTKSTLARDITQRQMYFYDSGNPYTMKLFSDVFHAPAEKLKARGPFANDPTDPQKGLAHPTNEIYLRVEKKPDGGKYDRLTTYQTLEEWEKAKAEAAAESQGTGVSLAKPAEKKAAGAVNGVAGGSLDLMNDLPAL